MLQCVSDAGHSKYSAGDHQLTEEKRCMPRADGDKSRFVPTLRRHASDDRGTR